MYKQKAVFEMQLWNEKGKNTMKKYEVPGSFFTLYFVPSVWVIKEFSLFRRKKPEFVLKII